MELAAKDPERHSARICEKCPARIHGIVCSEGTTTGEYLLELISIFFDIGIGLNLLLSSIP